MDDRGNGRDQNVVRVQVMLRPHEIEKLDTIAGKLDMSRSELLRRLVDVLEDDLEA